MVITDFCRAFALSGRNLCVGHLSQGVAPCSRLPWAGRYCPFRARNDRALLYLLVVDNLHSSPDQGKYRRKAGKGYVLVIISRAITNYILAVAICLHTPSEPAALVPLTQVDIAECPEWLARAKQVHSVNSADSA